MEVYYFFIEMQLQMSHSIFSMLSSKVYFAAFKLVGYQCSKKRESRISKESCFMNRHIPPDGLNDCSSDDITSMAG